MVKITLVLNQSLTAAIANGETLIAFAEASRTYDVSALSEF